MIDVLSAAICLSCFPGGECRATLGIDVVSVCPTPRDEFVQPDVYSDGGVPASSVLTLRALDLLQVAGIRAVESVYIFHDGLCRRPLLGCIERNSDAL